MSLAVGLPMSRTATELAQPVPNCPGWTVRHIVVHVARVCVAWDQMMQYLPSDADARSKAYEASDGRPEGASMQELAEWPTPLSTGQLGRRPSATSP